jgi:hypothetical protein
MGHRLEWRLLGRENRLLDTGEIEGAPQAQERKVRDELTDRAQAA